MGRGLLTELSTASVDECPILLPRVIEPCHPLRCPFEMHAGRCSWGCLTPAGYLENQALSSDSAAGHWQRHKPEERPGGRPSQPNPKSRGLLTFAHFRSDPR